VKTKVDIAVKPFSVPDYVYLIAEQGDATSTSVKLSALDQEGLSALCAQFRADVFTIAGKKDPYLDEITALRDEIALAHQAEANAFRNRDSTEEDTNDEQTLAQLRRIDEAARQYVDNRSHGNYSKLCDALFDGRDFLGDGAPNNQEIDGLRQSLPVEMSGDNK